MQTSSFIPHEWIKESVRLIIEVGVLSGSVAAYRAYKERNKPDAEVRELNAKTELTLVKANIAASEMVRATTQDMLEQQELSMRLLTENEQIKLERDQCKIEKKLLFTQLEQCRIVLERHGLKAELDKLTRTSNG